MKKQAQISLPLTEEKETPLTSIDDEINDLYKTTKDLDKRLERVESVLFPGTDIRQPNATSVKKLIVLAKKCDLQGKYAQADKITNLLERLG